MIKDDKVVARQEARSKCRIFGTVKYLNQTAPGRVIDLSASGIALQLHEPMQIRAGMSVTLQSPELGHLNGTVRWLDKSGKIGIQLQHSTASLAQVSSYFRFFHQEIRPVLQA